VHAFRVDTRAAFLYASLVKKGVLINISNKNTVSADKDFSARARISLALISSLIALLVFPRIGFWPLAWVVLVPLFFAISKAGPKQAFFIGWLFGGFAAIGVTYWIFHALYFYSNAGLFVSLLFLVIVVGGFIGLYFALFTLGANRLMRLGGPPFLKALGIPILWVALEFCRTHLLSGIPWELLGHSQYNWIRLIQIADLVGVYGLSFLIVLTN